MKTEKIIEKIKKEIAGIKDRKLYTPAEILKMGVITDTNFKPSLFTFYRLCKSGKLKSVDKSTGKSPRYFVKGKDLKQYVASTYGL